MKKITIVNLIALFSCLTVPSNLVAGKYTTKYVDKYVYRISVQQAKDSSGNNWPVMRVYFSAHKNSRGKNSAIGSCVSLLSPLNDYQFDELQLHSSTLRGAIVVDALLTLVHTAYKQQKKVVAFCETCYLLLSSDSLAGSSCMSLSKFTLKNMN